ncbi:MAG: hypothetical protein KGM24_12405 [Elusimicrobia bacterium]|nr:hypothetical protein [Elusimicrobiota bacterium]
MFTQRRRRRSPAALLAAAAAVAVAAAATAEIAARLLLHPDALVYRDSADPKLGFELLPGARGVKSGVPVSINAQGMRDDPVAAAKPAGQRRVVVVGGQQAFGVGVPVAQTFVREAAQGLKVPGRVRTLNLSMYSYDLAQKVELACDRLESLQPDVVVLQASDDDAGSLPPPAVRAPRVKNWLREHSVLARWAAERRYLRRSETAVPAAPSAPDAAAEESSARDQLRRFADCVKAAGARGLVMMISDPVGDGKPSPTALGLESEAKALKLPYFDAGPAIRRLPASERLLTPNAPFLSPDAQRAAAEALKRALRPMLLEPAPKPKAPKPRPSV